MGRFAQIVYTWTEDLGYPSKEKRVMRCIDMGNLTDPPSIERSYISALTVDNFLSIVESLATVFHFINKDLDPNLSSNTSNPQKKRDSVVLHNISSLSTFQNFQVDKNIITGMIQTCWPSLMASLSMFLSKSLYEHQTQNILNAHQSLIQICGSLKLTTPTIAFLTSFSGHCLPTGTSSNSSLNKTKKLKKKDL